MAGRNRTRDARRRVILELVERGAIGSQEQLVGALSERGVSVTQGTLSRDLKALGVGKVPDATGASVYRVLARGAPAANPEQLRRDFTSQLLRCRAAGQMVLLFTSPGGAGVLGRIIDELGWPEVEGTLAGDDTVLIVAQSPRLARALRDKIIHWAGL